MALAPTVPGAARTPETFAPVGEVFDVVAFDQQRLAVELNPRHGGRATALETMTAGDKSLRRRQQRLQLGLTVTAHHPQAKGTDLGAEQAAIAADFLQVVAQAPAPHLGHFLEQRLKRQAMGAVGQQVVDQHFLQRLLAHRR